MRITLILVIAVIILLAGAVGYIIGAKPNEVAEVEAKQASNTSINANDDPADKSITEPDTATNSKITPPPDYQILLFDADTDPLPLSLQAGIYFNVKSANEVASNLSALQYTATVTSFLDFQKNTVYVVILGPFKTEAELQLAKYELFKKHDVVTQRIKSPPSQS